MPKKRNYYVSEVADELMKIFVKNDIEFDGHLPHAIPLYSSRKGAIHTARLLNYARAVDADGRSFDYLLATLKDPFYDEAGVIACFTPAQKEVAHD